MGKQATIERVRRNLSRLLTGSVLSQAILAISTPILTRLFSPDAFGVAALFSSAYALLIPITTLKYDQAIVQPRDPRSATSMGAVVVIISTVISGVIGLAIAVWLLFFQDWDALFFLLLPIALWFGSAYTLIQQWSARVSNYTHYAHSQVIGSISNLGICISSALVFSSQPIFLVLGFTAGIGIALLYSVWGFRGWPYKLGDRNGRAVMRQVLAYKKFPMLVLPTSLVVIAGINGIPFVISHFYTISEVGLFAVANRVLLIPAAIIGGSIAEAVRSEFAACQRARTQVTPVFIQTIMPIFALAALAFLAIFLAPTVVFEVIFGWEYVGAGYIVKSLVLATFSQFVCSPYVYIFAILKRPAKGLIAQILVTLFPLSAFAVFASQEIPLSDGLFIYSIFTLIGGAIMLSLAYRECKIYDQRR